MEIMRFDGPYRWLSNFAPCRVTWHGAVFMSVEAFYQAMKSDDPDTIATFVNMTGGEAKKAGRKIRIRSDWDSIKVAVMKYGLQEKFKDPGLREALLATGVTHLKEGNYWHDNFWGDCYCPKCVNTEGINTLGKLLMDIRSVLLMEAYEVSTGGTVVVNMRNKEPYDVRIDRKSKWGNPFIPRDHSDDERNRVCDAHLNWLPTQTHLMNALHELVGKRLACWCAPKRCHGDNLILVMRRKGLI